ncbi:hypothetical protein H696_06191, partial [Fonticula alba]
MGPPAARLPGLLLLLPGLLAASEPEVFLHAAPGLTPTSEGTLTLSTSPGQTPTASVHTPAGQAAHRFLQTHAMASVVDYRRGDTLQPGPAQQWNLPPAAKRAGHILLHTRQWAAFFDMAREEPLPGPAATLLAGSSTLAGLVHIPGPTSACRRCRTRYFLAAGRTLYHIMHPELAPATSTEPLLPAAITHLAVTRLAGQMNLCPGPADLARLRLTPSPAGEWVLTAGRLVLLAPDPFYCHGDTTVACDSRAAGLAGAPRGWTCSPGHIESPLIARASLRAGRADGFYLDRDSGAPPCTDPDHRCKPCGQAHCRICNRSNCLLCQEPFLLQPSGPRGSTLCVASCSAGFAQLAGACVPVSVRAAVASLAPPLAELLPGLGPGVSATGIGATRLALDPATHRPVLSMPDADIGNPSKAAPRPTQLLPPGEGMELAPIASYAEAGPLRLADHLAIGAALVAGDHGMRQAWLTCPSSTGQPCTVAQSPPWNPLHSNDTLPVEPLTNRWIYLQSWNGKSAILQAALPGAEESRSHLPGEPGAWLVVGNCPARVSAYPWEVSSRADSRQMELLGRLLPDGPPTGECLAPVLLPRGGHLPPGLTLGHFLAAAARPPGGRPNRRAQAVTLHGNPVYPSAPVLLTRAFVGVSLLRCSGGEAKPEVPCSLLDASFFDLHHAGLQSGNGLWAPAIARAPGPSAPGTPSQSGIPPLALLVFAPSVGPQTLVLAADRPTGTFGPECAPCNPLCGQCSGPSADECTACAFWMADAPTAWLAACPAGLCPSAQGQCLCHPSCDRCAQPVPSEPHVCSQCRSASVPAVSGSPADHRLACDPACADACPAPGRLLDRTCVEACPSAHWPDTLAGAGVPCPAGCAPCTSSTTCVGCRAGYRPEAGGLCRPCPGSCATCTPEAACDTCMAGLAFLDPDPGVPSLCGSTCTLGEYVGAGRCAACDGSCELCAGRPDRCQPGCASCTSTACLSAETGLLLSSGGQCASACPAGWHSNGESCQPCDISCAACVGGMVNQCAGCAAGLGLVEVTPGIGACVSGCPEGQYRAGAGCLPCDAACATCNGPTDKDCWRCASGVLQGGDC